MSTVTGLLDEVRRYGGRLVPDGDGLRVRAPAPLPPELMDRLRAHKPDLIHALKAGDGRWDPDLAAQGYQWCLDCRHWGGKACAHPENPFRTQQPLAARKCRWHEGKEPPA